MSEAWRNTYDHWKIACPEDELRPEEQAEEDARAEDAAIERAERQREDMMFDRDSWEDR